MTMLTVTVDYPWPSAPAGHPQWSCTSSYYGLHHARWFRNKRLLLCFFRSNCIWWTVSKHGHSDQAHFLSNWAEISQAVIVHNVKPVFADITNDAGGKSRSTFKVVVRPLRIPGWRDQQVFTTDAGCHSTRDSPRRIVWWSTCGMFTCNWVTDHPQSR